jgi:hypothetical protein
MPEKEHPILALAREAEEIADDMFTFFNPVEKHFGPHEDDDWPRDLTPGELAGLIQQLCRTIGSLSDTIGQMIAENQADPDKARLVTDGIRLIEQGEEAIRAGETLFGATGGQSAAPAQQ